MVAARVAMARTCHDEIGLEASLTLNQWQVPPPAAVQYVVVRVLTFILVQVHRVYNCEVHTYIP
jgi:hypothetical protein